MHVCTAATKLVLPDALSRQAVDGSYVLQKGKIHKVPADDGEALRSALMGIFEKRRARNFFL